MGDGVLLSASTVIGLSLVNLARSEPDRAVALLHLAARDSCLLGSQILRWKWINVTWTRVVKQAVRAHRRGANSWSLWRRRRTEAGSSACCLPPPRHTPSPSCPTETVNVNTNKTWGIIKAALAKTGFDFLPEQTISSLLALDRQTLTWQAKVDVAT